MSTSIAILAGGLATRLKPISKTIPKSLIEINGKAFIDYQLETIASKKIRNVVICIGNLGEKIRRHIKNGNNFGLNIEYSDEGQKLLGTGGAILKALPLLSENFFVMYGDSYLDFNYQELSSHFLKNKYPIMMAIYKNSNRYDKSNVLLKDNYLINYKKNNLNKNMSFIDYGISIMNKKLFRNFNHIDKFDLSEIFEKASNDKLLGGYEVKNRFYEIGSFAGLKDFKNKVLNK